VGGRLQHSKLKTGGDQHLLDTHLLPMMRHRLDLGMQHRVMDEAPDAMRARLRSDRARISDLVVADIEQG
jgi:hypothetical protein